MLHRRYVVAWIDNAFIAFPRYQGYVTTTKVNCHVDIIVKSFCEGIAEEQ